MMRWQGSNDTGYLASVSDHQRVPVASIVQAMHSLRQQGFTSVVTGAIAATHVHDFVKAGFVEQERLVLLRRGSARPPLVGQDRRNSTSRVRARDLSRVLAIDRLCFEPFWQLDIAGLHEALAATARYRFRIMRIGATTTGYVICGFTGTNGFIQRLAVHPNAQQTGIGTSLIMDAIKWMYRRGVTTMYVNTHSANVHALALYDRLGFDQTNESLCVMGRELIDL